MNRFLKYSSINYVNLNSNPNHKFTFQHALVIYKRDTIYTFITKNACNIIRLLLAITNGCIKNVQDFNWIHQNNNTFVVLRNSFKRVASGYLDKIVDRTVDAWNLYEKINRKIRPKDMIFRKFIDIIFKAGIFISNIHWRPQIEFLVYEEYDDYFALENFNEVISIIEKKAKIKIYDARNLTKHGLNQYKLIIGQSFSDISLVEIFNLK